MNDLVTCVCLTEKRVPLLKRAVECFEKQSYDHKEMLIVYKDNDKHTMDYLNSLNKPSIRTYAIPGNKVLTLGKRRNISIQQSKGEYFCQWDDDDWYHRDRIKHQMNTVNKNGKEGSLLTRLIFFDAVYKNAYLSFYRSWENTIICKKNVLEQGYEYPELNKKEDTQFVQKLIHDNKVSPADVSPHYIYIYHGSNTWNNNHFNYLFSISQKLSPTASQLVADVLEGKYTYDESSDKLSSEDFLNELNYFYIPNNIIGKQLKYRYNSIKRKLGM